jgi:Tol biopolymer transport system component
VFLSSNLTGRYNLWHVDSDGSGPVRLTLSEDAQSGLSPSPDGRRLLFTQDAGGNEYSDVYEVPTAGGPVVQLTKTPDVTENNPRFSSYVLRRPPTLFGHGHSGVQFHAWGAC